jgi:hypothetical protein
MKRPVDGSTARMLASHCRPSMTVRCPATYRRLLSHALGAIVSGRDEIRALCQTGPEARLLRSKA